VLRIGKKSLVRQLLVPIKGKTHVNNEESELWGSGVTRPCPGLDFAWKSPDRKGGYRGRGEIVLSPYK